MNLIQLALAAEAFFQHQPGIQLEAAQCVRTRNMHATCARCAEVCPTGAIQIGDGLPKLDAGRCIKCGVCAHTCPVGAFTRPDGLYRLLRCVESLPDRTALDLVCAHHPAASVAGRDVTAVVQLDNCLSELGPSAFAGLMALGVKRLRLRLDACATCPLRVLQPQIEQSVARARQILTACGLQECLRLTLSPDDGGRQRPLYQSRNPPVSRRGFLTMFAPGSAPQAKMIAPVDEEAPDTARHPSRDRQRLLNALHCLAGIQDRWDSTVPIEAEGFILFRVQETCTACGVCERVCPTEAMRVIKDAAAFAIEFTPGGCTDCGLCLTYCEPGALQAAGAPSAGQVLGAALTLYQGLLRECARCKTRFAGPADERLCPVCRYRRSHPGSVRLPEKLLAQLPAAARARLSPLTGSDGSSADQG